VRLERNTFNGRTTLQATVEAVLPAGTPLETRTPGDFLRHARFSG
jgi:hypothetical protein